MTRVVVVVAAAIALAGCVRPVEMVEESSRAPLPEASYTTAAQSGAAVFRVVPAESLILVHVGRAGRMQRLGHEHAVASEDLQGFVEVADDAGGGRADIAFPLRNLSVDKPDYRERLSLDTGPSDDDIAGTDINMLKVLEPALYPWATIHAGFASGPMERPELAVSVTLHGTAFDYLLPVDLAISDDRLTVSGTATIRHQDFGLEPYSAAGGLLRVADELDIEFHITADRLSVAGGSP